MEFENHKLKTNIYLGGVYKMKHIFSRLHDSPISLASPTKKKKKEKQIATNTNLHAILTIVCVCRPSLAMHRRKEFDMQNTIQFPLK